MERRPTISYITELPMESKLYRFAGRTFLILGLVIQLGIVSALLSVNLILWGYLPNPFHQEQKTVQCPTPADLISEVEKMFGR